MILEKEENERKVVKGKFVFFLQFLSVSCTRFLFLPSAFPFVLFLSVSSSSVTQSIAVTCPRSIDKKPLRSTQLSAVCSVYIHFLYYREATFIRLNYFYSVFTVVDVETGNRMHFQIEYPSLSLSASVFLH